MIDASFTKLLMRWHSRHNKRQMPWKGEKDPYKVWLSEIILQQTRVDQGWSYYEKLIAAFPRIEDLAAAEAETVFKLWEGLGYYSRCRNLLAAARHISHKKNGVFPETYQDIIKLKGVGPYTAAAIASFCFNLPHAVVDGNVFRVLSRIGALQTPTDSSTGKHYYAELANKLLDAKNPGAYNQAIMDFGATVCMPRQPGCSTCVMKKICLSYQSGHVSDYPVKANKITRQTRYFNYFVLKYRNNILIHQRKKMDIWQHLWEFALIESSKPEQWNEKKVQQLLQQQWDIQDAKVLLIQKAKPQQLTHRTIEGFFIVVSLQKKHSIKDYEWVPLRHLSQKTFSRFCNQYIAQV